ncbi:MAG: sigma-54-dependent Fis family transcriptional regulator [Rhodobacteraceae bacterium]|nr:sigma-54-dependent Fis family transcriptional regulator [Paracoccaceae bacterium]
MSDILVIDDEKDIRDLIGDILEDEGHQARLAWNSTSAFTEINAAAPDLIILDIWLKNSELDGIDILKKTKRDNPDIPVVIISGHGNIEIAVAAVKQGAYDFIEKPFNIDQLMVVVSRALEASKLRRENTSLRQSAFSPEQMIGETFAFKSLKNQLEKVAHSNGRVMLSGPAGSGKEIAARFIHALSDRHAMPFVSVNSASIEPERMEEVLFGVENGATGHQPGLFEQAHGGVLFFDDVADMPLGTQSRILRVLVDQQFSRVGGSDTVRVDVRVISATNRDLIKQIKRGKFREELFHRLNVVPVTVPSLEERRDDIPLLCAYFAEELNRTQGLALRDLSPEALAKLQTMNWPGNVRQLRNTMERVLILGPEVGKIKASELEEASPTGSDTDRGKIITQAIATLSLREAREIFEREYLVTQIDRFAGNISRTSSFVGMERSALHRKMKSLGISSTGDRAVVSLPPKK